MSNRTKQYLNYINNTLYLKDLLEFSKADNEGRLTELSDKEKIMSYLIITLGIPGSGKSTWRNKFVSLHPEYKVICPDDLRREITGDVSNISQDAKVWEKAYSLLNYFLLKGHNVIFDSTAVSSATRTQLEKVGKEYNAVILYKIFDIDCEVAKSRIQKDMENKVDRSNVPMYIVDRMYSNFESAKKSIMEKVKNLDVFLIEEKYKGGINGR